MNAAASDRKITPLEFMLRMMHDPSVDPFLCFKAAQASARYIDLKPTDTSADVAGAGPMIIDATSEADRARIDERLDRLRELDLKALLHMDDLPTAEEAELGRLRLGRHLAGASDDVRRSGKK
jgi:hypothetical protein